MKIHLEYFAQLRERAEKTGETLDTQAVTPQALAEELKARYGFAAEALARVAVGGKFAPLDQKLADGDRVAFIPPVGGG